jgi:hypothetical protein
LSLTYLQVPRVYPVSTSSAAQGFLGSFLARVAGTVLTVSAIALGFFGDSQELTYGEGRAYCPRFVQRCAEYFGYVACTGWCVPGSSVQNTPLVRGAGGAGGATGTSSADFPPGFDFPTKATNTLALTFCLQPDMIGVLDQLGATTEAQFAPPRDLIDPSSTDYWVCDILLGTKGYTSEATFSTSMLWEIRKHTGSIPNASGTLVVSNTESGLNLDVGTKAVVKVTTAQFQLDAANKYTTLVIKSGTANPVMPIAIRFRNVTRTAGIAPTWFSVGGATTGTVAATYGSCQPVLAAMQLDAIAMGYGANDGYSGAGYTAAQFKANVQALAAFVRGAAGKPLPMIGFVDCWRIEATAPQAVQYDQYAGAWAEIADSDPLVRVVNTRLVTEKLGWTKSGEDVTGLTGGAEWAVTTAYTTSNYVKVTGADVHWYKCILNHTSAAADKPMTGANWRTYWRRVVRYLRSDVDLTHHSWEGGCLKADIDVASMLDGIAQLTTIPRVPRGVSTV